MSVATNPSLATPPRIQALTVRMAPYLVESLCELTRAVRDKTHAQTEVSGLLFGVSEDGLAVVEALKTFKENTGPRSDLARRERLDKAFETAMDQASGDPEFDSYKLIGWFSMRNSSGLLNSDVEFHNRHFRDADDLALVIWREADTQVIAEFYSKSDTKLLSSEDYRWSSVRLSTEMRRISEPIDLVMRIKINEDAYVKTYQASKANKSEDWKKMAASAKRKVLSFLPSFSKPTTGYTLGGANGLSLKAALATPKRADNGTLFRPAEIGKTSPERTATYPAPAAGAVSRQAETAPPRAARSEKPEISGVPMVINPKRLKVRGFPWLSAALVCIVFSAITFGILALKGMQSGSGKLSQIMHVIFPGSDLGLRVESQGERLLLSWNRRNATVASASEATLHIYDGQQHRVIRLDGGQVADGSVLYKPVSDDVTFRLEVRGTDQSTAMGSMRVLDATNPAAAAGQEAPVPDLNAPAAVPANSAASQTQTPASGPKADASSLETPKPIPGAMALFRNTANGRVSVPVTMPPHAGSKSESQIPSLDLSIPPAGNAGSAASTASSSLVPAALRNGSKAGSDTAASNTAPPSSIPANPPPAQSSSVPQGPPSVQRSLPGRSESHQASGNPLPGTGSTINGWDPNVPEVNHPNPDNPPDAKSLSFIPPRPLLQVMPNTRSLTPGSVGKVMRVEVEVRIDQAGHVTSAHVLNDGNTKTSISSAALSAARQWTFQPATLRGEKVESDHTIVFEFRPESR